MISICPVILSESQGRLINFFAEQYGRVCHYPIQHFFSNLYRLALCLSFDVVTLIRAHKVLCNIMVDKLKSGVSIWSALVLLPGVVAVVVPKA